MNGFLNLNKPLGRTSSDLVVFVRRRLPRGIRVGHGGTLDPDASGVPPVCVGGAARLFDYIIDKEKTYVATLSLGVITDTQDASGIVLEERNVTASEADVEEALTHFVGDIQQIPPMYSAIKKDGRRLYQLARKGQTVEVAPRTCRVSDVKLLEKLDEQRYQIEVRCGKGVYIRTLCHDIGAYLGCGAHMASLTRTRAGAFSIEDALTPEQVDALCAEGRMEEALLPMDYPLGHLPRLDVGKERLHAVQNGNPLRPEWLSAPAPDTPARVYVGGTFCGIAQKDETGWVRFKAMLL